MKLFSIHNICAYVHTLTSQFSCISTSVYNHKDVIQKLSVFYLKYDLILNSTGNQILYLTLILYIDMFSLFENVKKLNEISIHNKKITHLLGINQMNIFGENKCHLIDLANMHTLLQQDGKVWIVSIQNKIIFYCCHSQMNISLKISCLLRII